jgi:hypothetical protein
VTQMPRCGGASLSSGRAGGQAAGRQAGEHAHASIGIDRHSINHIHNHRPNAHAADSVAVHADSLPCSSTIGLPCIDSRLQGTRPDRHRRRHRQQHQHQHCLAPFSRTHPTTIATSICNPSPSPSIAIHPHPPPWPFAFTAPLDADACSCHGLFRACLVSRPRHRSSTTTTATTAHLTAHLRHARRLRSPNLPV